MSSASAAGQHRLPPRPEPRLDPVREKFVDDRPADRMLTRDYRKPYVVPRKSELSRASGYFFLAYNIERRAGHVSRSQDEARASHALGYYLLLAIFFMSGQLRCFPKRSRLRSKSTTRSFLQKLDMPLPRMRSNWN